MEKEKKVRLVKQERIRLTKVTDVLSKVRAGMGWNPSGSGDSWDLDQTIIVINSNGKVVKEISYRETVRNSEFYYHGDDLTGGSGGNLKDDEMIDINFAGLDPDYSRMLIIMNIYQAYDKGQDLSMVKNAYIHLLDVNAQRDLVEYKIENTEQFSNKTGMFVGEFYKSEGEWEFQAIGEPVRVRDISEMVAIIKGKYSNSVDKDKTWEEYLRDTGYNETLKEPNIAFVGESESSQTSEDHKKKTLWQSILNFFK